CALALGSYYSGLFSNDENFGTQVRESCESAGEPAWPLPTSKRYAEEITSSIADLSNMGRGREGGASVAAVFLKVFVGQIPWVHLDIAGCMDLSGPAASGAAVKASGKMVHALTRLACSIQK